VLELQKMLTPFFQNGMAVHAQSLSERYAEAERIKNGALQEAIFYRAKLTALETRSTDAAARLERERSLSLEHQLVTASNDRQTLDRRLTDLADSLATTTRLREHAEEQATAAIKRAEQAEATLSNLSKSHGELEDQHVTVEASLREHARKVASLSSLLQQREAEHSRAQSQLENLSRSRDQQLRTFEQLQDALTSATNRSEEAESQLRQSRDRIAQLEADQVELRNEIESRQQEAEAATARVADAENGWAKSREEADGLRALATGGLGELLDLHREAKANEERSMGGQGEKLAALEDEIANLKQLLKDSDAQITSAHSDLASHRRRLQEMTSDRAIMKSQLAGARSQLAEHISSSAQFRRDLADCETRLQDALRGTSDAELRLHALRNHLAENDISVDIEELIASSPSGDSTNSTQPSASRVRELEVALASKTRQLENLERRQQMEGPEARSRLAQDISDALSRAEAAERQLIEATTAHKEQMARMEDDYKTAVHYVK
jgi:chromosome segregation ATPase